MSRFKLIFFFLLVLLFAGSSIVLSGIWKDKKNIKKVEVAGNTTLSKDEIFDFAKLSDSVIKSNALTLEIIEARIAKHPNIKSVNATRENGNVRIEISEKDPFAVVTNGKDLFLLDDKLSLYNVKKENAMLDIPVISGMSSSLDVYNYEKNDMKNLKIAQYIIQKAIKIDKILYNYISEINFSDTTGIKLYTSEDAVQVYFVDFGFVTTKNGKQLTLRDIDINNTDFRKTIDQKLICLYNFIKQVVVYKSRYSFSYIDLRYKDIVLVKNNNLSTTE
ncbi:MAG: FtsQ-type POTRA domain-containing protein [Ignavibacteriae bacterium]|nr:MAG: FtsQ-type POTRA domain-containing protein [Ignavibacteriota bacterium]